MGSKPSPSASSGAQIYHLSDYLQKSVKSPSVHAQRAIPQDFARNFSDKEFSRKMKIKTQWGSSWEVGISKNPRFYFMEKSGWEKFVGDNALGDHEFLTFTHKGKMRFTVKIFMKDGKEMIQPPQSRAFLASSSLIKTEQDVKMEEEVVVPSESSSLGEAKTAAESTGGGMEKKKLKFGKNKADESQNSKRTEKMVSTQRNYAGASSSSVAGFNIFVSKSYLICVRIPATVANEYLQREKTMFKIHHPDGKKSWDVVYLANKPQALFSAGWTHLCKEYPLAVGDTCKISVIKQNELLPIVSKP